MKKLALKALSAILFLIGLTMSGVNCCGYSRLLMETSDTGGLPTSNYNQHETKELRGIIYVNTTREIHTTNRLYLSIALDLCIVRARWGKFNFTSVKLKTLARALSPTLLRLGGTDADFLIFNKTVNMNDPLNAQEQIDCGSQVCAKKPNRKSQLPDYRSNFTMSVNDWDCINIFAAEVGWGVLFDFNMLLRNGSLWDSANAQSLLKYTTQKGYRIAGWELGNEPNHIHHHSNITITADQLGHDYVALRKLLDKHGYQQSLLVGPSITHPNPGKKKTKRPHLSTKDSAIQFLKSFLRVCDNSTDATTWHSYFINGRNATVNNFTDPHLMNTLKKQMYAVDEQINKYRPYLSRSWLGETAGAYGGGAPGLSNTFAGGFLWLDKLGLAATHGVDLVIRQSFYGNYYSLLDEQLNPTPSYWISLLYKQLVGPKVLYVNSSISDGSHQDGTLPRRTPTHIRSYGHCSSKDGRLNAAISDGSLTIFVINLQQKNHVTLALSDDLAGKNVYQYLLSPHGGNNITATQMDLNGNELKLSDNDTLPLMDGEKLDKGEPITLPPLTYGFYLIDANAEACL